MAVAALSAVVLAIIRLFARPPPKTMNEQYQKMSNEYLKVCPRRVLIFPRFVHTPDCGDVGRK